MKEKYIQNAMEQFLRDTVTHYNSSNRAMSPYQGCCYSPTAKSDGCAIGRHVLNKEATRLLDYWLLCGIFDGVNTSLKQAVQFSPKLLALPIDFLNAVQELHDAGRLHDLEKYWDEHGLSGAGSVRAVEICNRFGLDKEKVFSETI